MNKKHRLSQHGIDLLKQFEGFSALVYKDPAGIATIGYGHVLTSGERDLTYVTAADAEALLRTDCEIAENYINATAAGKGSLNGGYSLNQNQFDALVLLVFNIGITAYRHSTLLRRLQNGDKTGASEQFLVWNKITVNGVKKVSRGLVNRRAAERLLFLKL